MIPILQPEEPREPRTLQEWQEAADAAEGALALDSARLYGLVKGGPVVDVNRCVYILDEAFQRYRVRPAADAIERFSTAISLCAADENMGESWRRSRRRK